MGSDDRNYQIKDLSSAVAEAIPGTTVKINKTAQPDTRSYKVDFLLFASLAKNHQPQVTLWQSIDMLAKGLRSAGFADPDFRNSAYIRLKVLEAHIAAGRLTSDLRWSALIPDEDPDIASCFWGGAPVLASLSPVIEGPSDRQSQSG